MFEENTVLILLLYVPWNLEILELDLDLLQFSRVHLPIQEESACGISRETGAVAWTFECSVWASSASYSYITFCEINNETIREVQ